MPFLNRRDVGEENNWMKEQPALLFTACHRGCLMLIQTPEPDYGFHQIRKKKIKKKGRRRKLTTQIICICVFSKCYFSYLHLHCMIRQNGRGSWKTEGTTYERKRLATPSSTKAWLIINRQCHTHCLISLQIYLQAKLPKTNYFYIYHNIKAWLFTSSARRKA